jgi:hypothetical protein
MYRCNDPSKCYDVNGVQSACISPITPTYGWWFSIPPSASSNIPQYMIDHPAGASTPATSTAIGSSSYSYTQSGKYTTGLKICDNLGCCPVTGSVTVTNPQNVPEWREISPF